MTVRVDALGLGHETGGATSSCTTLRSNAVIGSSARFVPDS